MNLNKKIAQNILASFDIQKGGVPIGTVSTHADGSTWKKEGDDDWQRLSKKSGRQSNNRNPFSGGDLHPKDIKNMNDAFSHLETFFKGDKLAERTLDMVKPVLSKNKKIKFDPNMQFPDGNTLGYFYHKTGKIGINSKSHHNTEKIYAAGLHEMVHAATMELIESSPILKDEFTEVLTSLKKKFGINTDSALVSNIQLAKLMEKDDTYYGLTNEHEMIAEVFTNKAFYNLLKETKVGGQSLLQKVYTAIAAVFSKKARAIKNIRKSKEKDVNVADYLMKLTESVLNNKQQKDKK